MKWYVGFAAVLFACSGCTPSHVRDMTKKTWQAQKVTFPEMENVMFWMDPNKPNPPAMSHGELNRRVAEMETGLKQVGSVDASELKALGAFVKDAGFQDRLKALESATIPAAYASPERDEARRKYLQEWKDIEKLLTSGGKFDDVKKSQQRLDLYYRQMQFIPGQTPPTGKAAEKYSGVEPYEDPYKQ